MVLRRGLLVVLMLVGGVRTARTEEPKAAQAASAAAQVTAVAVEKLPLVDGKGDEALWAAAPVTTLRAAAGAETVAVDVRACVHENMCVLLLAWRDATADRTVADPAAAGKSDVLRVAWARRVQADGTLDPALPGAEDVETFDAAAPPTKRAVPEGVWADGVWTVEMSHALGPPGTGTPSAGSALGAFTLAVSDPARGLAASGPARVEAGAAPRLERFEADEPGAAARALRAALAGKGKPPSWVVRADDALGGRVLVQEAQDMENDRYPLALVEGFEAHDVDLSVRFQARKGFKDRAAGIVWRVKDAGNHYLLRANALESNVVLYKMQDNLRIDLPPVGRPTDYGVEVKFDPAAWHTLRAVARGDRFQAYLDGSLLFEVVDATFPGKGGVGLWTKSDSVMAFDDLLAVPLDPPAPRTGGADGK